MPQEKIGRYKIITELGRGGMATVYHAYDPHFQREVALKVLPPNFTHDPTFRARFEQEAQTIATLEHPAIVPVYDFGEENDQLFLVMRYLSGGSLASVLDHGSIDLDEARRIVDRLATALDEAHRLGIIHRDLKPDNILFDQRQEPYITDFGIAKLSEGSSNLTTGGMIIGTPAYMSPEQASGLELDGRSDIYALGVILFQMLTGRLPFEANTPVAIIMYHMTKPIPPILNVNPDLPPGCEVIINKALAKDREERYNTAGELAEELRDVGSGSSLVTLPPATVSTTKLVDLSQPLQPESEPPLNTTTPYLFDKKMIACPTCGAENEDTAIKCLHCNEQLKLQCPRCFTLNQPDAVTCVKCGANLKRTLALRRRLESERKQSLAERDQVFRQKRALQLKDRIPELLKAINMRRSRLGAQRQLKQLAAETVDILSENALSDPDPDARIESLQLLDKLFDRSELSTDLKTQIANTFIDALQDEDADVRHVVERSMERLGLRKNRELADIFSGLLNWLKGD